MYSSNDSINFMNSKLTSKTLAESVLSKFPEKRLEPFLKEADWDSEKALELYAWNARISAATLELVAYVEVLFRNAIDNCLREYSGEENCGIPWFLRKKKEFAPKKIQRAIDKERGALSEAGKETRDQIVASMPFGFWLNFLDGECEDLWRDALHKGFPNAPRGQRKEIWRLLDQIRKFRNRIAHHESLLSVDVGFEVAAMFDLVEAIDMDVANWMRSQVKVHEIAKMRPVQSLDTVIVPARDAWELYEKANIYICQLNRYFRPVEYMAFYENREIKKEVPKIKQRINNVDLNASEAARLRQSADGNQKLLGRRIKAALSAGVTPGKYQVFILSKPEEAKLGNHVTLENGLQNVSEKAFVRKQRYTSIHKLRHEDDIWNL